jgi:hypothetical protein
MMPAPLTPPDSDLQDFPFMPLHVARLRDSDLAAEESPEACWYAVVLWAASWHQLPAGSLPDNDAVLMRLVGLGRDNRTWKKHRAGALRGFILCDDGRLYHPVVAEQVVRSWQGKLEQRHRTECARIKKANQRNGSSITSPDFVTFVSEKHPQSVPYLSLRTAADVPEETASKGERQREGEGQRDIVITLANANAAEPVAALPEPSVAASAEAHLWDAGKRFLTSRGIAQGKLGPLIGKWKRDYGTASVIEALGVAQTEPDLVDPVPFIEKVLRRRRGDDPGGYSIGGVRMSSPC